MCGWGTGAFGLLPPFLGDNDVRMGNFLPGGSDTAGELTNAQSGSCNAVHQVQASYARAVRLVDRRNDVSDEKYHLRFSTGWLEVVFGVATGLVAVFVVIWFFTVLGG